MLMNFVKHILKFGNKLTLIPIMNNEQLIIIAFLILL